MIGLDGLAAVRAAPPMMNARPSRLRPGIRAPISPFKSDPDIASIPVIVVSADALGPQIDAALAAGATRYLTKPVDVTELLAVVDDLLARMDTAFS